MPYKKYPYFVEGKLYSLTRKTYFFTKIELYFYNQVILEKNHILMFLGVFKFDYGGTPLSYNFLTEQGKIYVMPELPGSLNGVTDSQERFRRIYE